MNILFMHISKLPHMSGRGISLDLLREFSANGHDVSVLCAADSSGRPGATHVANEEGIRVVRVNIGENKSASLIRKGMTTLLISGKYVRAIKEHFSDIRFGLVMYPTPPVTIAGAVEFVKKRDGARSYLLLKDIFPQNSVDIGMMTEKGPKGLLCRYFRSVEKRLYSVSDFIGCMSPANARYVLEHNPDVDGEKVEVCPNSISLKGYDEPPADKMDVRREFGLPSRGLLLVYGGNLGKPQGIPFLIDCLRAQRDNEELHFLVVGDGTEYGKIQAFIEEERPGNVTLRKKLPRDQYESLIAAADAGMIFLDARFTIPNFPSRVLSYMRAGLPVLCAVDSATDMGEMVEREGFGVVCRSGDVEGFSACCEKLQSANLPEMGARGRRFLENNFTTDRAYETIMRHFE